MKLPDFAQTIEFIRLRQQMGATSIPALPKVTFIRTTTKKHVIEEIDEKDKELLEKLKSPIEVNIDDIDVQNGPLVLGGRKVVAYIRDWRVRNRDPRFHLWDCAMMQHMRRGGRERRYLATRRSDSWFEVNYRTGWGDPRSRTVRLRLCQFCRDELVRMGWYEEPFSLKRYFEQHDSGVPRTVRRIETVEHVQEYQPNQYELSRKYQEAVDYRCQLCKVKCPERSGLLQLHHRDGDTSNNAHHNLAVLCFECHANQPYHGQMGRDFKAQRKILQIEELRRQQNLTLTPQTSAARVVGSR